MSKFTYFDLLEITENENNLKALLGQNKTVKIYPPKKEMIDNILNYSKALSIRKSENLEFIEIILN